MVALERRSLTVDGATAAVVTLNRPEKLNAIDWAMLREIGGALDVIERDRSVRVVLVTGAGRAFSAGGDLGAYVALQRDSTGFPAFVRDFHETLGRLRSARMPTVALVNGVTAAGGLELVLNCDICLVGQSSRLGDAHLNYGQMGGGGVLTLLPRRIGLQRASELIFSGRFLSAQEAVEWGIASRVVEDEDLLEEGLRFAETVAKKSPLAVANAKEVLQYGFSAGVSVAAGLTFERERNAYYCLTSDDAPEGLRAFDEKRDPRFSGS